jgi:hypothetical protein
MPSTYTTNGGIELIATGEQSGTWGDTTNDNLQIIDRLTNGVGAIALSGTTHTLTTSDGALSDGQYKVLVFGGSPSGTNTVTITPNTGQHLYFVKNGSGQSVVLTQGSGGNVTVANGKSAIVYADGAGAGAAVVDLTSTFVPLGALLAANNLSDLTNVATARANLDLEIGVDVQAYDADLAAIAGLAVTDGNIIVGNGTTWVAESGATARTSLGIGTGDSPTFAGITTGQVDITATGDLRLQDTTGGQYVALQAPGTVSSSFTLTLPAADGTSGQVLQTNGSGLLTFATPASGGTLLASDDNTNIQGNTQLVYTNLALDGKPLIVEARFIWSTSANFNIYVSADNGTSYTASLGYRGAGSLTNMGFQFNIYTTIATASDDNLISTCLVNDNDLVVTTYFTLPNWSATDNKINAVKITTGTAFRNLAGFNWLRIIKGA